MIEKRPSRQVRAYFKKDLAAEENLRALVRSALHGTSDAHLPSQHGHSLALDVHALLVAAHEELAAARRGLQRAQRLAPELRGPVRRQHAVRAPRHRVLVDGDGGAEEAPSPVTIEGVKIEASGVLHTVLDGS